MSLQLIQQSYYVIAEPLIQQSYYVTAEPLIQPSYYVIAEPQIQQSYCVLVWQLGQRLPKVKKSFVSWLVKEMFCQRKLI